MSDAPIKLDPKDLTKAMFLREVKKNGGASAKVEESGQGDAQLAAAMTQRSINTQGVIAVPAAAVPKDLSMATALTQHALSKSGGKAVSSEKAAKLDASKARALTEMALKSGKFAKEVDVSKVRDTAPSKDLLADIQKEAAEVKEAQAKQKALVGGLKIEDQLKKTSLKKAEGKDADTTLLKQAMFLREVGAGGVVSVPEEKLSKLKSDPTLAAALLQRSIKTQGVIAVPAAAVPKDLSMATALTQHAISKSGGRNVSSEKAAKLDASTARALTEMALKSGKFAKEVDVSKVRDTAPSKDLLADIQKEAAEVKEAQAKQKALVGGLKIEDQLKKTSLKKAEGKDADTTLLKQAMFLREVGAGGVVSVPEEKLSKLKSDPTLAAALLQRSIKTQGVIAVPRDKAYALSKADQARFDTMMEEGNFNDVHNDEEC